MVAVKDERLNERWMNEEEINASFWTKLNQLVKGGTKSCMGLTYLSLRFYEYEYEYDF